MANLTIEHKKNIGAGVKRNLPRTAFKKGNQPRTEFKKGHPKPKNACRFGKGENHWNWNGGKFKVRGYVFVQAKDHP